MRCFLALELPEKAISLLEEWSKELQVISKEQTTLRWTSRKQYHVTLRFFGDIEQEQINAITTVVSDIVNLQKAFYLEAKTLGAFSNWKRPRVLWAGLKSKEQKLQELFEELDEGFASKGLGHHDQDQFKPHITLARIKNAKPFVISELFSEQKGKVWGESYKLDSLVLFKSELTPRGAVYTPIKKWRLKGEG